MNLKSLHIFRLGTTGDLTGNVEFINELGTITLRMDEQFCKEILAVCGQCLVRQSQKAADEMSAKIIQDLGINLPQIESDTTEGHGND